MTDEELRGKFAEELRATADQPVTISMTTLDAYALISQIQLAEPHVHNDNYVKHIALGIAHQLENAINPGPAMQQVIDEGWDTQSLTLLNLPSTTLIHNLLFRN